MLSIRTGRSSCHTARPLTLTTFRCWRGAHPLARRTRNRCKRPTASYPHTAQVAAPQVQDYAIKATSPHADTPLTPVWARHISMPRSLGSLRKEGRMALEIKLLSLIDIDIESSFLVLGRNMGVRTRIPTFGFLILGGKEPVVVDTGAINAEIMQRLGMTGYIEDDMTMEAQLAKYDLLPEDVRWILHTHLHIDHCGQDYLFPNTTTVVINRRELEYSVSELMGEQYPAEYIKH